MSASNSKLTLIANPKNFAERENNKAYYQAKFFSKGQQVCLKEKKRKEEVARKEIAKRHEFGDNPLVGRNVNSKSKQLADWEYTKKSLKLYHERMNIQTGGDEKDVVTSSLDVDESVVTPVVTTLNVSDSITTITPLSGEEVDSWEDLC